MCLVSFYLACLKIFKFNSRIESNFTTRRVKSKILSIFIWKYFHIWDHMEQYQQHQKKGCVFLQGVISSKPPCLKTVPKEQEKSMVLWCATFLLRCFPDTILHFQALQLTPSRILNWIFKLLHGLNALWVCLGCIKFIWVKIPSWITKLTSFCFSDISIHSWRCIHWGFGKFV